MVNSQNLNPAYYFILRNLTKIAYMHVHVIEIQKPTFAYTSI